jgi:hypothetical protein
MLFPEPLVTTVSPEPGTVTIACPALPLLMPFSVSGCAIVTCSAYVPGQTSTVDPDGTLLTAAEIVVKLTRLGLQVPTATVEANTGTARSSPIASKERTLRRDILFYLRIVILLNCALE